MSLAPRKTTSLPIGWVAPPTIDEVRLEDGHTVETPRHFVGRTALYFSLDRYLDGLRRAFWMGCDAPFYFSAIQARDEDFRAPDLMIFLEVERKERKAWLTWDEGGKQPDVIVELMSESTAHIDRTTKKRIYGPLLRVPNYILFDPFSAELEVLEWSGHDWLTVPKGPKGRHAVAALGLEAGIWEGTIAECDGKWLRWFQPNGTMLPTPGEAADEALQRAHAESERAHAESERAHAESERAHAESERAQAFERRLAEYELRFGKLDVEAS